MTKIIIFSLFTLLLASCGGGGGGSDEGSGDNANSTVTQDYSVTPSELLYKEGDSYSPGQIVVVESATPFVEGESVSATDENGRAVQIIGQQDGSAAIMVPIDAEAGQYVLTIERGLTKFSLTISIATADFPLDARSYVSNFKDKLRSQVIKIIEDQGVPNDEALLSLLNDINDLDADSMNETELSDLSKLLYVNSNYLVNDSADILQRTTIQCTDSRLRFLKYSFVVVANIALLTSPEPISKPFFTATLLAATYQWTEATENVVEKCPGLVANSTIQSLDDSSGFEKRFVEPTSITGDHVNYASRITTGSESIAFYDGDSKKLNFIVTVTPDIEILGWINKFKSLANGVSWIVPNNLLETINSLGEGKEVNLTDGATFEQVTGDVFCSGSPAAYTCGFPSGNSIYSSLIEFEFSITHTDYEESFVQSGRVLPRDIPFIEDQSFNVIPGPGEVNRIVVKVTEDIYSPNYELTKVIGYELISKPSWGVILNEFNDPGVLDYAADIEDDMPESTQFEVRVWNRYGWSDSATITLELNAEAIVGDFQITSSSNFICSLDYETISNTLTIINIGGTDITVLGYPVFDGSWDFNSAPIQLSPGESAERNVSYNCSSAGDVADSWRTEFYLADSDSISQTISYSVSYPECHNNTAPIISLVNAVSQSGQCSSGWGSGKIIINFSYFHEQGRSPYSWMPAEGFGAGEGEVRAYEIGVVSGSSSDGEYWTLSYVPVNCEAGTTFAIRDSCNTYSNAISIPAMR
ncbi:MAG: hypothetical protein JKX76_03585 [Colwellia sp.]|nr:hypothetical protein [Colwellia sp.]